MRGENPEIMGLMNSDYPVHMRPNSYGPPFYNVDQRITSKK